MAQINGTVTEVDSVKPPLRWVPDISGDQTKAFLEKQQREGKTTAQLEKIISETTCILGRCANPLGKPEITTGLVVGRIQSGKTMSFTTLAALAHDNNYGLIIILAGTKNNLIEQTVSRIQSDLQISEESVGRWIIFKNPQMEDGTGPRLCRAINAWADPKVAPSRRRVPLVVVLKHSGRMGHLAKVLGQSDLHGVPTLLIDDEADQAGLNTYASRNRQTGQQRMSSNYANIRRLRSVLPFHSYVQYTATPQANLLVDLNDELAPDFAEVLIPGEDYKGGKDFFFKGSPYTLTIPDQDLQTSSSQSSEIPLSLLEAFSAYIYGCAYAHSRESSQIFTMMIHPSQETSLHKRYYMLARQLLDEWISGLSDGTNSVRSDYIYELLDRGRAVLQKTFKDNLPSPESLPIYEVLVSIELREVNATPHGNSRIVWGDSQFWLLVGGAKLDRGFTVKGLTITYMPRSPGDGMADSIQQRARFFGYNRSYFDYCRVYLESNVRLAFENYVEHEEVMHGELMKHKGYPLGDWPRKFMLDSGLDPTRKGVIGIPLSSFEMDGWKTFGHLAEDISQVDSNRDLVYSFIYSLPESLRCDPADEFPEHFIDKRKGKDSHRHFLYENVNARDFLDRFLNKFLVSAPEDRAILDAIKLLLERLVATNCLEFIDLFVMRGLNEADRSCSDKGRINPYQGRSPTNVNERELLTYGGDQSFCFSDRIAFQIHMLNIYDSTEKNASCIAKNCPWLCIYVPNDMSRNIRLSP
jgi:hypothetical protein